MLQGLNCTDPIRKIRSTDVDRADHANYLTLQTWANNADHTALTQANMYQVPGTQELDRTDPPATRLSRFQDPQRKPACSTAAEIICGRKCPTRAAAPDICHSLTYTVNEVDFQRPARWI